MEARMPSCVRRTAVLGRALWSRKLSQAAVVKRTSVVVLGLSENLRQFCHCGAAFDVRARIFAAGRSSGQARG